MPIKLFGPWNDGYALDQYTVSSEYIGDDSFGRPQFINTYSEVGKLLHSMKYNGHYDTSEEIAEKCKSFLDEWLKDKKNRHYCCSAADKTKICPTCFHDWQRSAQVDWGSFCTGCFGKDVSYRNEKPFAG